MTDTQEYEVPDENVTDPVDPDEVEDDEDDDE